MAGQEERRVSPESSLFVLSFQRFVDCLQSANHEVSHSVLKNGTWAVTVNPRPFVEIRTKYSDATRELEVAVRRPFRYREQLRMALDADSVENAVARAVAVHDQVRR